MIVLTEKTRKLLKVIATSGFHHLEDLVKAKITDTAAPAICMMEGCDHVADMEKDQDEGFCEVCGGTTMTSAFVLGGVI